MPAESTKLLPENAERGEADASTSRWCSRRSLGWSLVLAAVGVCAIVIPVTLSVSRCTHSAAARCDNPDQRDASSAWPRTDGPDAYATLITSSSYLPGLQALVQSLREAGRAVPGPSLPLVVMRSGSVSESDLATLLECAKSGGPELPAIELRVIAAPFIENPYSCRAERCGPGTSEPATPPTVVSVPRKSMTVASRVRRACAAPATRTLW